MGAQLPADPFGRVPELPPEPTPRQRREAAQAAAEAARLERVRMIADAAAALLEGHRVDRAAGLFLGSALLAWLENGGRVGALEKHYLRTTGPSGSHATPQAILQRVAPPAQEHSAAGRCYADQDDIEQQEEIE